ncbi:hypothetical protein M011DRAFT_494364 [Sporormia fimetaria CBS 119925]|uniref:G-protein coupled receptors family 2 profile 2 domain-containing protein n=1 Tax=Sporormia fimetaria CBS 119925 TaxID=1340428 RepID=A0A6A6VAJ7_9PLEO|nr:hypothetical protein M011DRAFT_494364 [Sporormia fimetaria CBS 119925]
MARPKLSEAQVLAITSSERSMSVLSVLGSLFIMTTFLKWHYFRKPINRLVFYASFGNVLANVATLIGTTALPGPGEKPSALCQFQGVLIQWFMMADSLWVFSMALNVMLVFFHSYNSRSLRQLEKWYLLFSYGVPFIPALIYIIVEKATAKRIYGPATIWCWIDARVEWLRIAFFYVPVWVVVCLTLSIYVYTGYTIFMRRRKLAQLSSVSRDAANPPVVIANPFTAANAKGISATTEISVRYTTDSIRSESTAIDQRCANDSRSSFSSTRNLSGHHQGPNGAIIQGIRTNGTDGRISSAHRTAVGSEDNLEPNPNYKANITADGPIGEISVSQPNTTPAAYNPNHRRNAAMEGNSAAWSYFKVAFLMFAALFIVWVPSTVNRLQQFIDRDDPIFGLNLASALVLPLQGFWNAMVYISTTWPECKRAFTEILDAVAAIRHPNSARPVHRHKDSQHTLTTGETQEFETVQIGLQDMLKSNPHPQGQPRAEP